MIAINMVIFRENLVPLIGLCSIFLTGTEICQSQALPELRTIAELQTEYLKSEIDLWQRVEQILSDSQGTEENAVNQTIIEGLQIYRDVFFENTIERTSNWRSELLYPIENLYFHLSNINATLNETFHFIFDENQQVDYKPMDVSIDSTTFRRLKENREGIFNLTINKRDAILRHVQEVRTLSSKPIRIIRITCINIIGVSTFKIGRQRLQQGQRIYHIGSRISSRVLCKCWQIFTTQLCDVSIGSHVAFSVHSRKFTHWRECRTQFIYTPLCRVSSFDGPLALSVQSRSVEM